MSLIRDFEKRLEGIIEGAFSRLFKVGVHPVEIAKRVIRESEGNKQVSVGEVIAPNLFLVRLSPPDHQRISRFRDTLLPELEKLVMENALRNGYTFLSRPSFRLQEDADLPEGRFEVEASVASPKEAPAPSLEIPSLQSGGVHLEIVSGPHRGFTLKAREFPVNIGRAEDNHLVLDDPLVSRHHAVIDLEDGNFVLRDLGSTNGTYIGTRRIQARLLERGDVLRIGSSEIAFRPLLLEETQGS